MHTGKLTRFYEMAATQEVHYDTLSRCSGVEYEIYTADHVYNDLIDGRVGALLSASIRYGDTKEENLIAPMKAIFDKLVKDAYFYNDALIWVSPPGEFSGQSSFAGNIGIYLGLWLINTYYNADHSLSFLAECICFDVELLEVPSVKQRKQMQALLKADASSITDEQIYALIDYVKKSANKAALEIAICVCIKSGLFRTYAIAQQLDFLLLQIPYPTKLFFDKLLFRLHEKQPVPTYKIKLTADVVSSIIRSRFDAVYQFCGEEFVEQTLAESKSSLNLVPNQWLSELYSSYPDKTLLFKQIIWRERFLLKMPHHVFTDQTYADRFNYHLDFLNLCYQRDVHALCSYKFKLDKEKIIYMFNTFCIKLLLPQNFAQLNQSSKVKYFNNYYRNAQFSLLLVKRHEKNIVWQGRSFTHNSEVDFLFYFMKDFHSINEYKNQFGDKALDDSEILEIFFWALELGIVEPHNGLPA